MKLEFIENYLRAQIHIYQKYAHESKSKDEKAYNYFMLKAETLKEVLERFKKDFHEVRKAPTEIITIVCPNCGEIILEEEVSKEFFKELAKTELIGDPKEPDGQLFVVCDKCKNLKKVEVK